MQLLTLTILSEPTLFTILLSLQFTLVVLHLWQKQCSNLSQILSHRGIYPVLSPHTLTLTTLISVVHSHHLKGCSIAPQHQETSCWSMHKCSVEFLIFIESRLQLGSSSSPHCHHLRMPWTRCRHNLSTYLYQLNPRRSKTSRTKSSPFMRSLRFAGRKSSRIQQLLLEGSEIGRNYR